MAARDLWVRIRADVTGLSAGLAKASAQTRAFGAEVEKSAAKRQAVSQLGTTFMSVGIAGAAGVGLLAKAAIDWETAWAGVTKTVSGTPAQLAKVETGLRQMARTLPSSHQELAAVAEAAGQLGIATPNLLAFTRVMVNLGVSTNLSADEAATSIAQLMNVMQTAPGDVDNLGAALVALGNNGASTERDIVQMAQRIGGAGKIVGLTTQNVLGISNALASVGVEVEAGGSAIARVLTAIDQSVAAGGSGLASWADVAQQSAEQFAAAWKADPAKAFASIVEGLGRIDKEGGNVFATLSSLGQTDVRVSRALLSMANAGGLLSKSLSLSDAAWIKNTALTKEAEKRYDTTAAKAKIAWNTIKDNAISAGQALLPVVASIAKSVADIANAFGSLPGPVKSGLGVIAAVGSGALLAIGGLLKLVAAVAAYRNAMTTLQGSQLTGATAFAGLTKKLFALAAAYAAVKAASSFLDRDEAPKVNALTGEILKLGDAGKGTAKSLDRLVNASPKFGLHLDGWSNLASAIDDVQTATHGASGAIAGFSKAIGLDFAGDSRKSIEAFDQALTGLVQSGALDEAARGAQYFAAQAKIADVGAADANRMLPQYNEALKGVSVSQKLAAIGAKGMAGALKDVPGAAGQSADAIKAMRDEIDTAAQGFINFSDVAGKSLKKYIADLEKGVKAQQNWADNVIKATARGLDPAIIEDFRKMGPEGAKMLDKLANGAQANIDRMNAAFRRGAAEAERLKDVLANVPPEVLTQFRALGGPDAVKTAVNLAKKYNLTPDQVETILKALDVADPVIKRIMRELKRLRDQKTDPKVEAKDAASAVIKNVLRLLRLLHDKKITVYTYHKNVYHRTPGNKAPGNLTADGAVLPGPQRTYADGGLENHVAQIAPAGAWRIWAEPETGGEAYIPLAPSKRDRSLQIWAETGKRLGIQGFAEGMAMGGGKMQFPVRELERAMDRVFDNRKFDVSRDGRTLQLSKARG